MIRDIFSKSLLTGTTNSFFQSRILILRSMNVAKSKIEMFLRFGTPQSANHLMFLMSESIIPETINVCGTVEYSKVVVKV